MSLWSLHSSLEVLSLTGIVESCYRELSWIFIDLFVKETKYKPRGSSQVAYSQLFTFSFLNRRIQCKTFM